LTVIGRQHPDISHDTGFSIVPEYGIFTLRTDNTLTHRLWRDPEDLKQCQYTNLSVEHVINHLKNIFRQHIFPWKKSFVHDAPQNPPTKSCRFFLQRFLKNRHRLIIREWERAAVVRVD